MIGSTLPANIQRELADRPQLNLDLVHRLAGHRGGAVVDVPAVLHRRRVAGPAHGDPDGEAEQQERGRCDG